MKTAVFPNIPFGDTVNITHNIVKQLISLGAEIYMDEEDREYVDYPQVKYNSHQKSLDSCDIIIAIGGDGTVTEFAREAAVCGKPILGVNGGHLGFLSGLEKTEISRLSKLADGSYKIKEHMLLKAEIIKNGETLYSEYCVNDAVVGRITSPKMINVTVTLDGHLLGRHRADGVIIATPTGSTAYSMSAGGPVADPNIECMIFTPICSHSLTARSVICSSSSVIEIVNTSEDVENRELSLVTDSLSPVKVENGCCVRISKADISVDFIHIKESNFYEILNEKMIERIL